jgi:hypothetical protein
MSMASEGLRNEETRAGGMRTVAAIVNSFETLEEGEGFLVRRPFRTGRDPLEEARRRVRAQRRVSTRIPTLGEPGEARQDGKTAPPGDPKLVNS